MTAAANRRRAADVTTSFLRNCGRDDRGGGDIGCRRRDRGHQRGLADHRLFVVSKRHLVEGRLPIGGCAARKLDEDTGHVRRNSSLADFASSRTLPQADRGVTLDGRLVRGMVKRCTKSGGADSASSLSRNRGDRWLHKDDDCAGWREFLAAN